MLFYVKKYLWLDLTVTLVLGGIGYLGIRYFHLPFNMSLTWISLLQGLISFVVITGWTFLVQKGYAVTRGREYAEKLTESLAKNYANASVLQAINGGVTAALGEELFFRGFLQAKWGIILASVAFGLAHFGKRDIRIVSYWSFVHGLLFGFSYSYSRNLLVPVIAHGLFDLGGMIYFRHIMRGHAT